MRMTQKLKGIDNIKRAMARRVEEREDVMKAEALHAEERQTQPPVGEDGCVS